MGDARAYVRELMERVVPEQAWRCADAGRPGHAVRRVKNGSAAAGRDRSVRWSNSTGCVTAGGRVYAVAVLSDGHASMADGVARVEEAARKAVEVPARRAPRR
ncbi:putative protein OS=Streptomyces albaduncus OX=68172 GN=FHS32_005798 PE=4 SV=1 [Streptomyces griseoloalbus]